MNRTVAIVVIIICLLVGFLASWLLTRNGDKTEVIVNIDTIKEIAQLATVEYHMSIYEHVTKKHAWYEWKNAELLVLLHGVVRGLIDLDKIDMEKTGDKAVLITIPGDAIVVTNPEFGPDDIEAITISDPNIFHKITDADRNKAVKKGITDLKNKAIEEGIKDKTLNEAKVLIANFLANLGFEVKFAAAG